MKTSLRKLLIPACLVVLVAAALAFKPAAGRYDYMIIEYIDSSNDLSISSTNGSFATRNVKTLLLDRYNDRTPFLNEIKTQESNGWETYSYEVSGRGSNGFYTCLLRKAAN